MSILNDVYSEDVDVVALVAVLSMPLTVMSFDMSGIMTGNFTLFGGTAGMMSSRQRRKQAPNFNAFTSKAESRINFI